MAKNVLLIDPGHGGKDPGAGDNGIVEKAMTLEISLYQFKRFKELGVNVLLTRDSDVSLDSDKRPVVVKNSGATYCISNHINAAPSDSAQGAEVIHSIHNDGKLAHAIAYALKDAGQKLRPRPVFTRQRDDGTDYYYMHHDTGAVSTNIVEYGFCSNAEDAARLKANWKKYAEAVVRAYCAFIDHPYTAPVEAVSGFTDIATHWARTSIQKAIAAEIMSGVSDTKFDPNGLLTRAQLCVILDRLGLLPDPGKEVK